MLERLFVGNARSPEPLPYRHAQGVPPEPPGQPPEPLDPDQRPPIQEPPSPIPIPPDPPPEPMRIMRRPH